MSDTVEGLKPAEFLKRAHETAVQAFADTLVNLVGPTLREGVKVQTHLEADSYFISSHKVDSYAVAGAIVFEMINGEVVATTPPTDDKGLPIRPSLENSN